MCDDYKMKCVMGFFYTIVIVLSVITTIIISYKFGGNVWKTMIVVFFVGILLSKKICRSLDETCPRC